MMAEASEVMNSFVLIKDETSFISSFSFAFLPWCTFPDQFRIALLKKNQRGRQISKSNKLQKIWHYKTRFFFFKIKKDKNKDISFYQF